MSFHWNFALGIITCLLGIGVLLLFPSVSSIGWQSVSLLFAVALILSGILRLLNFFFTSLPEGHCKRLASSVGFVSGSLYYILRGQSIIWIALSWILLFGGIRGLVFALQGIWVEGNVLRVLHKAYKEGEFPNLPMPFIYVLAEPGFGIHFGHRLVTKTICSLAKHRYFPAESRLRLPVFDYKRGNSLWKYRHHVAMSLLVSDSVRRYPINFRKWLASQAAAFIVIRTSFKVDKSLVETFDDEARSGCQICPGSTFMIYLRFPRDDTPTPTTRADQTLECTQGIGNRQFDSVIAPLVNRFASTAFPTGVSDIRLTKEVRPLIQETATCALPLIADCYLRFRMAQSNVERFLSLLDSIESLIKCSVIVLLVNRWDQLNRDISNKRLAGRPPTLGSWVHLLQKLTTMVIPNELDEKLCGFWRGNMFQVQIELINEVSKAGLPLPDTKKFSHLDWLEWFRDLRNVTRGHGVVTEKSVAPLWHLLHETFLEMISALRPLALSTVLVATEPNSKQVSLRGWLRGGNRPGSQPLQAPLEYRTLAALKSPSSQLLFLHPLVIIHGNKVLLWDCLRKKEKAIEFLNYASDEREQLAFSEFSDTDPYEIWKKDRSSRNFRNSSLTSHNSG